MRPNNNDNVYGAVIMTMAIARLFVFCFEVGNYQQMKNIKKHSELWLKPRLHQIQRKRRKNQKTIDFYVEYRIMQHNAGPVVNAYNEC